MIRKILSLLMALLMFASAAAGAEGNDQGTDGPDVLTTEAATCKESTAEETAESTVLPETVESAKAGVAEPEEVLPQEESLTEKQKAETTSDEAEIPAAEESVAAEDKPIPALAEPEETAPAVENETEEAESATIGETSAELDVTEATPSEMDVTEETSAAPAAVLTAESFAAPEEEQKAEETAVPAAAPAAEAAEAPADVLTAAVAVADVLPMADYSNENSVRGFVYRLYSTVFQRKPDDSGLNFWVNQLESGANSAADVVSFFFNSKEYNESGKTNAQIVTDCYNTMMNRTPEEGGFNYWKRRLDIGMTPQTVLAGFVYSDEFAGIISKYGVSRGDILLTNPRDKNYERTYFVFRLYYNCLERDADLAGEEYWCEQLDNGTTGVEVASGFFFSDEFNKNRYNNSAFVQLLYKAIQGRDYDTDGLIHWTNRLNLSDTREKVLNGFILSPEFQEQCRIAEISAGDPLETPDDSAEWQYNIQVLRLCNNERRLAGLGDLYTREDLLWDLAIKRAEETTEVFSHTRPNGTNCFSLFKEQGFYGYLGENIAAGTPYADPIKVVDAWMNSEGHRANILNPNYTYLATGYVYSPDTSSYCADGKYQGQYVNFVNYAAQSFCNYGIKIK